MTAMLAGRVGGSFGFAATLCLTMCGWAADIATLSNGMVLEGEMTRIPEVGPGSAGRRRCRRDIANSGNR